MSPNCTLPLAQWNCAISDPLLIKWLASEISLCCVNPVIEARVVYNKCEDAVVYLLPHVLIILINQLTVTGKVRPENTLRLLPFVYVSQAPLQGGDFLLLHL